MGFEIKLNHVTTIAYMWRNEIGQADGLDFSEDLQSVRLSHVIGSSKNR